jgi:hypothetical protein
LKSKIDAISTTFIGRRLMQANAGFASYTDPEEAGASSAWRIAAAGYSDALPEAALVGEKNNIGKK